MMETRDLGVSAAEILNRDKGRCLSGSTYGVGGDPIEIADRDRPWIGHAWIAEHRVIERLHVTTKGSHRHDRHADCSEEREEAAGERENEGEGKAPGERKSVV